MLFGWRTTAVSFLTLSAVSVNLPLSLTLYLRYRAIVTVRRVLSIVFLLSFFWYTCTNVLDDKVEICFIGDSYR